MDTPQSPFRTEKLPDQLSELEEYIRSSEDRVPGIYPQARAQVVWATGEKVKTPLSLVYLHGFRATHQEGDPAHYRVARHGGYNLYLSRHAEHGLMRDLPLQHLQPEDLAASARNAIEIGLKLGEKVILMGTSTGGSMALWLAGLPEYRSRIHALILYAPLINFHGWPSLLKRTLPRTLLRIFPGGNHRLNSDPGSERESRIWYSTYALQGPLALGAFIQGRMTGAYFQKVRQPVFTGYFAGDRTVSVPAIRQMHRQLGTDRGKRLIRDFPLAGTHVICSGIVSGAVGEVVESTERFLKVHAA